MRKSKLYLIGLLVLALSSCTSKKQQTAEITPNVPKIILETDIGNDVDDALALDMLYKYLDAGDIDLLGITINKEYLVRLSSNPYRNHTQRSRL